MEDGPVVLIAHGLNANKENFLLSARLVHSIGFNVFTFDFRAHGDSEGRMTTFGINEADDVKAAYDWVRREFPSRPIFALGYSMGGAAVVLAAAKYGIFDGIVLDSTYANMQNVAEATILRPMGPLKTFMWHLGMFWVRIWTGKDLDRDRPEDLIDSVQSPILLIHGKGDETIPFSETLRLHEAARNGAELWLIEGCDHVQGIMHEDYGNRLRRFFGE